MKNGIFLLLGSNQGDAGNNLAVARENIAKEIGPVLKQSPVYRSAAWGLKEQPDFLNQVIEIDTQDSPEELLDKVLSIEQVMGRVRFKKWGPRIIDIDILFYGEQVRDSPRLRLPHPGIPDRRFTLQPLADIAADLVHPVLGKTVATLLAECTDPLSVQKLS